MYTVFTVSQFHADVHSLYLVFDFVWHRNSVRKHEYEQYDLMRPQIKQKQRTFQISLSL